MNHRFNYLNIRKVYLIAILVFGSVHLAYSQQSLPGQQSDNNWKLGLNIGMLGYFGDVNTAKNITSQLNMGYGLSLAKQISPLFGLKGNLLIGKIKGKTDSHLEFNSDLIEAMINASFNFSQLCWGDKHNQMINVYGLIGLGLGNFNGSTINTSTGALIRSFGHHSGGGISGYEVDGIGNIGLCLDLDLGSNLNATIESAFKFTSDDKLDGIVSGFKYDAYNYTSLGIAYKFPLSQKYKKSAKAASVLPPLIISTVPEKKIEPTVPVLETKKVDSVIKPIAPKIEEKKENNVPANDSVDLLVNKLEKQMAKNIKKDELPSDSNQANDKSAESKKSKSSVSTGNDFYTGYKVQLFATLKSMDVEKIKAKYSFATNIRIDKVNKLYHHSIGTFATFQQANKFSLGLHKKKGLQKTFVVYFKNGKRIGMVNK